MAGKHSLLIVDDEIEFFKTASLILSKRFDCRHAVTGEDVLKMDLTDVDVVLLDIELGHGMDGFQVLQELLGAHSDLPVIMISRREDIGSVVRAMRLGACDYIGKQFNLYDLSLKVERALSQRRLEEENRVLREEVRDRLGRLVGDSPSMRTLRREVSRAAEVFSPVLITGESGTGKELAARDIHDLGPQAGKPFVPVNCAAIPETLFESLLFGHERGAFTGADKRQIGRIESAGSGTLFLDEIAEMPLSTQSKLLRVLQEKRFERLGSTSSLRMQARLITASNRDLEASLKEGGFRHDLYYRLDVLRIHIAPLKDRIEDIAHLAPYILEKKSKEMKRPIPRLSSSALQCLQGWHWPGNVRELENVLESALVYNRDDVLQPEDFPSLHSIQSLDSDFMTARKMAGEQFDRQYLRAALRFCGGNVTRAAERVGLSRYGLQKILKRLGMEIGAELRAENER